MWRSVALDAINNLFFQAPNFDANIQNRPQIIEVRESQFTIDGKLTWKGRDNLYAPHPIPPRAAGGTPADSMKLWEKLTGQAELGSRTAPSLILRAEMERLVPADDYLPAIRQRLDPILSHPTLGRIGPDWNSVGTGEAYVRALRAEGKDVRSAAFKAEPLPAGPVVVLREGQPPAGFKLLQEAVDAAVTGDAIEVRTDANVGGAVFKGTGRVLVVRAAPWYTPRVEPLVIRGTDRLTVEGLALVNAAPGIRVEWANKKRLDGGAFVAAAPIGSLVRAANCSFHGSGDRQTSLDVVLEAKNAETPEVVNCWMDGAVNGYLMGGHRVRIANTLLHAFEVTGSEGREPSLQFLQCAFWQPSPTAMRPALLGVTRGAGKWDVTARGCLFETYGLLQASYHQIGHWSGSKNLYRVGQPLWHDTEGARWVNDPRMLGLLEWQTLWKSDADSAEAKPVAWDPAEWEVLIPKAGAKPVGADPRRVLGGAAAK